MRPVPQPVIDLVKDAEGLRLTAYPDPASGGAPWTIGYGHTGPEVRPGLVVAPEHALKPALHEWGEGNLNAAADNNDIRAITRRINGGYNGLDDRRAWFERIWPLVNGEAAPPMADDRVRAIQRVVGAQVGGVYGPATKAAVARWQTAHGLVADGLVGPVTARAMGLPAAG
ncbi:hypothetical protein D3877_16060 [Azospirillum cavernae]|uniref:Lysozyme n=1 Tax=Azospirillum cavernae TaxID=2320860 RepID=A0A418VWW6_9PROT|nr:peptidoglycan-binding protein [Azospirillum cavernae]RJF81642.1 hypothetical protein D3877_16060 [Azospirillum cavernae]